MQRLGVGRQPDPVRRAPAVLNVGSSGPGSVQVEARRRADPEGSPLLLASVPLSANGVDMLVCWGGSVTSTSNATAIAALEGELAVLTIKMQAASLCSLRYA